MGSKQPDQRYAEGFAYSGDEQSTTKKRVKRETFLADPEQVVPWQALIDLIEPHDPKTGSTGGSPPPAGHHDAHPPDAAMVFAERSRVGGCPIEVPTMRRFAGIDLLSDRIPDETTILAFRHLLEKHNLGERIVETVNVHLKERGMAMEQGTIIDATLIAAPSSTKNTALGVQKTRLRGMVKTRSKPNVLAAQTNLYLVRR